MAKKPNKTHKSRPAVFPVRPFAIEVIRGEFGTALYNYISSQGRLKGLVVLMKCIGDLKDGVRWQLRFCLTNKDNEISGAVELVAEWDGSGWLTDKYGMHQAITGVCMDKEQRKAYEEWRNDLIAVAIQDFGYAYSVIEPLASGHTYQVNFERGDSPTQALRSKMDDR